MADLHSPGTLLKARWEELHSDTTATATTAFCRQSTNITSDLTTQSSNVGGFVVSIPNYSAGIRASCVVGNGHANPTMSSSSFVGQLPYISIGNSNHHVSSLSDTPFKLERANNILSEQTVEKQQPIGGNGVNGYDVNVGQVLVELERERQKNAELLGRLSSLEAKLQEKGKSSTISFDQDDSPRTMQNGIRKLKRTRKEEKEGEVDDIENKKITDKLSHVKPEDLHTGVGLNAPHDNIVNWMSREELQLPDSDMLKDGASDREEDDESDDTDDDSDNAYDDEEDEYEYSKLKESRRNLVIRQRESEGTKNEGLESMCVVLDDGKNSNVKAEIKEEEDEGRVLSVTDSHLKDVIIEKRVQKLKKRKERKKNRRYDKIFYGEKCPGYETGPSKPPGVVLSYKKAPKTAFCPKEVRRIMESGVLALKNAQSHTMRKIIVFASLGIRHGCEDMYELDFNHFTVLRKGEPYISPKDPGEHVLYEQPGVRRKIFYPNRQNPILCPVRILEEEKEMRPSDPSCPSCLFLCIKYGGRTRNLPQNEYVRQRMGRNKLKSFGPLMCQMAMLVHIRTGSFFFKALGITLLFMAGFTDDVVRRETKYCNLDLLQKYYRSDEDADGKELFHPYPMFYPLQAVMTAPTVPPKGVLTGSKSSGKRQPPVLLRKPPISQAAQYVLPISARSISSAQFRPSSFHQVLTTSGVTLSLTSPHLQAAPVSATTGIMTSIAAPTGPFPSLARPYSMFPPYAVQRPSGSYLSMPPWHHMNSYVPSHYPSSAYGYQAFQHSSQYLSHPSQPYYNQQNFPPFPSSAMKGLINKNDEMDESESETDTSSSDAGEKSNKSNSSEHKDI